MILRKRLFSAATAAALLATSVLPGFGGLVFAADDSPTTPKALPTSFSPPDNLSVTETPYASPTMYLNYTASSDWLDFCEAYETTTWDESNDKTTSPFGTGFNTDMEFNMQTDFRIDGGDWHYDESWDTTRFCISDSYWDYFEGGDYASNETNAVRLINGYEMSPEYADQEHYMHDTFASLYLTETDGEDNYYRFDFDNHQLEFRCRYFTRLTRGGSSDNYESEEEYFYIYSDWSDTVKYGKGEGAQYNPAKELDAPVLQNLQANPGKGTAEAPAISYFTRTPDSVLSLLNAPNQNKDTGLQSSNAEVCLIIEASLDGENWAKINTEHIGDGRYRQVDVWDVWNLLYRTDNDQTYALPTMPVYLRAMYSANIGQDGGAEYELSSGWSEPASVVIDGLESYPVNITHEGLGYSGDGTQSMIKTESAMLGYIDCPSIEGCYVQKVTVDGVVFYDKDDESTYELLNWNDTYSYFRFIEEANPEYYFVTKEMAIVITYGGTPTEQKTITLSYNAGGYLFPTNWPDADAETGLYTDTCMVYLGQERTIGVHVYDGFELVSLKVDGVENAQALADEEYTFEAVQEDHTVEATFKRVAYRVFVSCANDENGTVTYPEAYQGSGTYFPIGSDLSFVFTPNVDAETGNSFLIESIMVNNEVVLDTPTAAPYTLKLEKLDQEYDITVVFSETLPAYYTLTASVGSDPESGKVFGNGEKWAEGSSMRVSWQAAEGYAFEKLVVDGKEITNISGDSYIFPDVKENHTVVVYFKSTYVPKQFLLTVISHDASGLNTVTPNGQVPTTEGGSQTIVFTPHEGYYVSKLVIDGQELKKAEITALKGSYTFTNISADNSFEITFAPILYTVTFQQPDGTVIETQSVSYGKAATAPALKEYVDEATGVLYQVNGWDTAFAAVFSDLTVTATYFTLSYAIEALPGTLTYDISEKDLPIDLTGLTLEERKTYYPATAGTESTSTKGVEDVTLTLSAQTAGEASKDVEDLTKTPVSVAVVLDQYTPAYEVPAGSFTINVIRAAQTHLVTFKNYDGVVIDTVSVADGAAATEPTFKKTFALDGAAMKFARWDKEFTNVTEDMTVTAVFRKEVVTVSTPPTKTVYDISDGNLDQAIDLTGMMLTRTYNWLPAGNGAEKVKVESVDGFAGLTYSAEKLSELDANNPTVTVYYTPAYNKKLKLAAGSFDVTLQDQTAETYTVTFVDYDDTVIETVEVPAGGDAVPPEMLSMLLGKQFWLFTAWSGGYDRITSDTTVKAVYTIYELSLITGPTKTEYELVPGTPLDFTGLSVNLLKSYSTDPFNYASFDLAFDSPELHYSLTEIPEDAKAGTLTVQVSFALDNAAIQPIIGTFDLTLKEATTSYEITYLDAEGNVIGTQTIDTTAGEEPVYPELDPYVQSDNTTKVFQGWDLQTDAETGNVTATAMFLTYTLEITALPTHIRYLLADGDVAIDLSGMELTLTGVYSSPKAGEDFTRVCDYEMIEDALELPYTEIAWDYEGDMSLAMDMTLHIDDIPINADVLKLEIYKMGDVNRDGVINTVDAILTLKEYSGSILGKPSILSDTQRMAADADGNGTIDITDAILILKQYAASILGKSLPWGIESHTF